MMRGRAFILGFFVVGYSTLGYCYDFSAADALFLQREDSRANIRSGIAAYEASLQQNLTAIEKVYAIEQINALHLYHTYILGDENNDERVAISNACLQSVARITPSNSQPGTVQFYYWKAVCMMARANAQGVMASLRDAGPALEAIQAGMAIDSRYEGGGFDRLAGVLFAKLPAFNPFGPSGDLPRALQHFERALNAAAYIHPLNPSWRDLSTESGAFFYSSHFYYAEALAKDNQTSAALELIDSTLDAITSGDTAQGREAEAHYAQRKLEALKEQLQ